MHARQRIDRNAGRVRCVLGQDEFGDEIAAGVENLHAVVRIAVGHVDVSGIVDRDRYRRYELAVAGSGGQAPSGSTHPSEVSMSQLLPKARTKLPAASKTWTRSLPVSAT